MTFRDEAVEALRAGQNAEVGAENPYRGKSLALAKLWRRGYNAKMTVVCAATPARQRYLQGRAETG